MSRYLTNNYAYIGIIMQIITKSLSICFPIKKINNKKIFTKTFD